MTTRHRGGSAMALVPVLLATACASSESGGSPSGPADAHPEQKAPSPLDWLPCTGPELANAECAVLEVPMDYTHPEGETIRISLSRFAASDPERRIGSLLVNSGGPLPGLGWGLRFRDAYAQTFPEISARFDIVSFDPRGYGESAPSDCGDVQTFGAVDWTPDDDTERATLERTVTEFAAACREHTGPLLGFLDAYSVARDMDEIRKALGEETISYRGHSYGTVWGAAYADLFPKRLRATVLSGAVRPGLDAEGWIRERTEAWRVAFDRLANDCPARPDCAAKFDGDLYGAFDRAHARLVDTPLVDPATGEAMNESLFGYYVGQLANQVPLSDPAIEKFIADVIAGNGENVGSFVVRGAQGLGKLNAPAHCADRPFSDPAGVYSKFLPELSASNPRFGHAELPGDLACAHWPVEFPSHPAPHATGAKPILVVGSTGDAATPYWWSERLASELESAVLLTFDGIGHNYSSQCIDEAIVSYLLDLKTPAPGTVCAE